MISLEWVKDYIDIEEDLKELAVKITKAGINVEKVISKGIDNLVVGKVIECVNHPNSDHLHICQVDIGKEVLQIVCGAPNVRKDIKVIVAKDGAILPNIEIKKSKIRDVESNGMICSLSEIGLEEDTIENYQKGIHELPNSAKIGMDVFEYLGLKDTLYELDVHKHRNNDCYSHIGFAYEIATILNRKVNLPSDDYKEITDSIQNHLKLEVKTDKCSYYLAKMVTNIDIKPSPEFIKKRLIASGMRPINNVVDICNYVMLEYGQPLHFFDKDKLGDKILVREANNETIKTLDGKIRDLKNDIIITDGVNPVCIAGVMGGYNTEVDENTKTILIESAIFDSVSVRNTANRLDLKSEASIRYGKGLNYEYTLKAINRACHLLEKYANAKILSGIVSHDKIKKEEKKVTFTTSQINQLLGLSISNLDIEKQLERLDFKYTVKDDTFTCHIPPRRLDIDPNINDIAEEIARLYGYDNLKSTLPKTEIKKGEYKGNVKLRKTISKRLRNLGLNEVKTYTLVSKEMSDLFNYENKEKIILNNPLTSMSTIRTTLIPSLLNVYKYNKNKVNDILIYEIAKTYDINYQEDSKICALLKGNYITNSLGLNTKIDFYLVKGIVEELLDYLGFKNRYTFTSSVINDLHKGISAKILIDRKEVGIIGRISPIVNKDEIYVFELSLDKLNITTKPLKYKEVSKYPSIKKDVAFVIPKEIEAGEIINLIKKSGGRILSDISIFDSYVGEKINENEKSIAYSLTFNDNTKTLTDNQVNEVFEKIILDVTSKGYKLRDF